MGETVSHTAIPGPALNKREGLKAKITLCRDSRSFHFSKLESLREGKRKKEKVCPKDKSLKKKKHLSEVLLLFKALQYPRFMAAHQPKDDTFM